MVTTGEREIPAAIPEVEVILERAYERRVIEMPVPETRGKAGYVWGALRMGMGWIFFWAFLDKILGLGYATASEGAWINGGSPTSGFLNFATKGPFAGLFENLAGNVFVDWMFMIGLLVIGLPLMLGVGVRLAAGVGVLMLTMMYTAGFILPENNPFLDEHIIYAVIMVGLIVTNAGTYLGLGKYWENTKLVRRFPILK